jgi:hypothetical protein
MNAIILTKRGYKPLVDFSIFLLIFLYIRWYFVDKLRILKDEIELNLPNQKLVNSLFDKRDSFEYQCGFFIILFALLITYNLSKYFKSAKHKIGLVVFQLLNLLIIFSITNSEIKFNPIENDIYFFSLLIFVPFLPIIYFRTIEGKKVDVTEIIKEETVKEYSDNVDDLEKLLKLNLLSEKEYNEKKELQIKEKIRSEIKESEEYNLLLKSKQKGLLTENEFNIKVEHLINLKYQKEK